MIQDTTGNKEVYHILLHHFPHCYSSFNLCGRD
jgi:hypothetical protein